MKRHIAMLLLSATTFAGCQAATQNIPVSSNPSGAIVYADGTQTCSTPCTVTLEKTQAHILTLQKPGYKQADVQIAQKYDTGAVARNAVQSGTGVASRGASTEGAISNALLSTESMEADGSAYVLSPSSVVVDLVPEGQVRQASNTGQGEAPVVISSDQLSSEDQAALRKNEATIRTTEPATAASAVREDPEGAVESLLEAGAAAAPTVGTKKEWKSSHSSENFNNDGSYDKSTSSSSTSVGVSVNPVEAGLGVLHLLEDADKKKDGETSE